MSGSGHLSHNVRYTVPATECTDSDRDHPPIVLALSDGLLEPLFNAGAAGKLSLNVQDGSQSGGNMTISLGSQVYPLNPDSSGSEESLYRLDDGKAEVHHLGETSTHYNFGQPLKQDTTALAASRLKERRQEEALKKQNSRAVMLDQSQFDKRGRLASSSSSRPSTSRPSTPVSNAALALAASTSSTSGGGEVVQLDSPNFKSSSLGLSLSPRAGASMPLSRSSSSTAVPTASSSLNRGRSNSPALNTLLNNNGAPTKAPSLRQRIFHILASGPQTQDHILKQLSNHSEIPILRLLTLVADKDGVSFALKPELYKEVASSIQANTWPPETTSEEKSKIVTRAREAFEKIKLSSKAPEWKVLSKWIGEDTSTSGQVSTVRPRLARTETTTSTTTAEEVKSPEQPTIASEGKKRSTTRDRLTRAVKGKGPRGPELKKEQDKERRRLEKEKDSSQPQQKDVDVKKESKIRQEGSQRSAVDVEVERIATIKKGDNDKVRVKAKGSPEKEDTKAGNTKIKGRNDVSSARPEKNAGPSFERKQTPDTVQPKPRTHTTKQPSNSEQLRSSTATAPVAALNDKPTERLKRQATGAPVDRSSPATETTKRPRDSSTAATTPGTPRKTTSERSDSPPATATQKKRKRSQESDQPESSKAVQHDVRKQEHDTTTTHIVYDTPQSAGSSASPAKSKKRKSELSINTQSQAQASSIPLSTTSITSSSHHGPSPSASLLNAEPWLDIRTTSEWRRLAERFKRVYDQYDEHCRILENEKSRLTIERQIATTTPNATHVRQANTTRGKAVEQEELEEGEEEGEAIEDDRRQSSPSLSPAPSSTNKQVDNQYSWRSESAQKPLSMEQLTLLVQDQMSRQGELKRMKEVLVSFKSEA